MPSLYHIINERAIGLRKFNLPQDIVVFILDKHNSCVFIQENFLIKSGARGFTVNIICAIIINVRNPLKNVT